MVIRSFTFLPLLLLSFIVCHFFGKNRLRGLAPWGLIFTTKFHILTILPDLSPHSPRSLKTVAACSYHSPPTPVFIGLRWCTSRSEQRSHVAIEMHIFTGIFSLFPTGSCQVGMCGKPKFCSYSVFVWTEPRFLNRTIILNRIRVYFKNRTETKKIYSADFYCQGTYRLLTACLDSLPHSPVSSSLSSSFITTLIIHQSFTLSLRTSTNPSHLNTTYPWTAGLWTAFTIMGPGRTYHRLIFSSVFFSLICLFVPCGGLN